MELTTLNELTWH